MWIFMAVAAGAEGPLPSPEALSREKLSIRTDSQTYHFTVEMARTQAQKRYGLMRRTELPADHGMLFPADSDEVLHMWMKDTLISLDMLFIDSAGGIVYIAEETMPNSTGDISAGRPVRAVLELPAGTVGRTGIKVGDRVIHPHFTP